MNKKKVITNTFITVIAGLLALLFYSFHINDKNFSNKINIEDSEINSIEVTKISRNSGERPVINVTNQKEIKAIKDVLRDSKWVKESKSFKSEDFYSVIIKKDNYTLGEVFIIGNQSFLLSNNKDLNSYSDNYIFKDNSLVIENLFK
ncbi:hypothetical protein NQZ71_25815 (plasmid) [Niallia taxi]|uniref:hypothetical protein n=1 Tax=Niallia taxi TaxID=2499688 RepID=UPI0029349D51|nr:hypothetical protein [Niallia taxi]WOD65304.1 hypothetical protein NQZ71_25815 [Niallia taxi]